MIVTCGCMHYYCCFMLDNLIIMLCVVDEYAIYQIVVSSMIMPYVVDEHVIC